MSEVHHIIRQYTFEVQSSSRARALALQERISHLFRQQISSSMDALLQRVVPEQMVAVLDTLQLDVGTILYKDIDAELPERINAALEKALSDILRYGVSGEQYTLTGQVQLKTGAQRLQELLRHYLLSGTMPWWTTAAEREQPAQALLQLVAAAPQSLAALIRDIGRTAYVRERLAYQFPVNAVQKVVEALEPAEAVFIFAYSREVVLLQQKQLILQTESTTLERAVWWFVLNYLLTESRAAFNRRQFVHSHLTQMAQHFNVAYTQLLQLFYNALEFYRQDIATGSLGGFIKSLYQEHTGIQLPEGAAHAASHNTDPAVTAMAAAPGGQVALLRYYLLYGSFPWWASYASLPALYTQVTALAKAGEVLLQEMLSAVLPQEAAFKRWTHLVQTGQQQAISANENILQQLTASIPLQAAGSAVLQPEPGSNAVPPEQQQLRDVLLYRLLYGGIPWWGSTYAHFSINSLWQQLLQQSPAQAAAVLKYAGAVPYALERCLQETSPEVLLRIMQAAGLPAAALSLYESVHTLLQTIGVQITPPVTGVQLQQPLLKSLWQAWAGAGYGDVTLPAFIARVLQAQSVPEAMGLLPGSLLFIMKSMLQAAPGAPHHALLLTHIQELTEALQAAWSAAYHAAAAAWNAGGIQGMHPLLDNIRKGIAPMDAAIKTQTAQLVQGWWAYFLHTGNLPVTAGAFTPVLTGELVAKMLEWLYVNYREQLSGIAAAVKPVPAMLNQLFRIWQVMEATPTPVRELIAAWMQEAIAPLAADTMVIQDGLWQVLPGPGAATAAGIAPAAGLPAAVSRLLHRFRQYAAIGSVTEQQHWLQQAMDVLTFFLAHRRLPDHLPAIAAPVANELLKQAVILLFRERPEQLTQLFSAGSSQLAARVALYHLFTPPAGMYEAQVRESLETYAMQDSLLLLQETAAHSHARPVAGFREAVLFYAQQQQQERMAFYRNIFAHKILVEQAAQQLDDATFLHMMQDIHIGWGHPPHAALRELQQLFDVIITDSFEREKIRLLFRQFHIQLLAGVFSVHHAADYAQRFLLFITGSGLPGVDNFIGRLADTGSTVNTAAYVHLRNILPALQQQARQYVQTHAHMQQVRRQLYENERSILFAGQKQEPPAPAMAAASMPAVMEEPPPPRNMEKIKPPEIDTIYVSNAGLVLLHPFLSFAFQHLGWLQDGRFTGEEAQHRAIHFLQFTVNGLEEHPEHALALNKVLCNFPLEAPVPLQIKLTETEKQLSEQMIKVVIQQWEKMKNSSVEGFQGAFLQREGGLRQTQEAWFLRVEQRGYDVIMQTLPWGIGMIKAPWMDKVLYTEWVYT
jgi:hypothetical protein